MAFSPISYIAPNYRDYKNWWLKAYEPGTTTPKAMALESNGGTQVAKLELNKDGFLVSSGDALVIPYIDGIYDLWLFPTEAEADANYTANAERVADNIYGANQATSNEIESAKKYGETAPLSEAVADENAQEGDTVIISDRGNGLFEYKTGQVANGYNIVACEGVPTLSLVLTDTKLTLVKFGGDENAFDALISVAEALATTVDKKKAVFIDTNVTLAGEKTIDPTKVSIYSEASNTITFDDTDPVTNYPSGFALLLTSDRPASAVTAYQQTTSAFMSNIHIRTLSGNRSDLNGIRLSATGETIALNAMYNVRLFGFGTAFSNGDNGWGWSFFHCGWSNNTLCFEILPQASAANTYERFDFHGCIFQNSTAVFDMDNDNGKCYLHGCSIDYVGQEFNIQRGHVDCHGVHYESSNRTKPIAQLGNSTASFSNFGGLIAIVSQGVAATLFEQVTDFQILCEGTVVFSDGSDINSLEFSNKRCTTDGLVINSATRRIFNCEAGVVTPDNYQAFVVNITGSAAVNLNAVQNETDITVNATGIGEKTVKIFLPIPHDKEYYTVSFDYDATGVTGGALFPTKSKVKLKGDDGTNIIDQQDFIGGGSDNMPAGGTGKVDTDNVYETIKRGHNYVQISINCNLMAISDTLVLTNMNVYAY